jgi:hypothetical protein
VLAGIRSRAALPVGPFYTKGATLAGFAISKASVPELADAAAATNDMLRGNRLEVRTGLRLLLEKAVEAHRVLEGTAGPPDVKGRIVLTTAS